MVFVFKDRFILRSGGRFNYDVDGFTAGAGLRQPLGEDREIRVDYAFVDMKNLEDVNRFAVAFFF